DLQSVSQDYYLDAWKDIMPQQGLSVADNKSSNYSGDINHVKGNEDLIHKLNGDELSCFVTGFGTDNILYQFTLNGSLVETWIQKSEVNYIVRAYQGESPEKIIINPTREEEFTDVIILLDGSTLNCFVDHIGINTVEYLVWEDDAPLYQIMKRNDALYYGSNFLDMLDEESLQQSRYDDLIVTRKKSILLCNIDQNGRSDVLYSFEINKMKMSNIIERKDIVYAGKNFYKLEEQPKKKADPIQGDLHAPEVIIVSPALLGETDFEAVGDDVGTIRITGVLVDQNPIGALYINNRAVDADDQGKFAIDLDLSTGMNDILVIARDIYKNETKVEYHIERKAAVKQEKVTAAVDRDAPEIAIISPGIRSDIRTVRVSNTQKSVHVIGKVSDLSGVYEVLVNGRDAVLSSNGEFSKDVLLRVGVNRVIIKASDLELNTAVDSFVIVRSDVSELAAVPEIMGAEDKYYALIIGVSNYPDPMIPNLDDHPTHDAERLSMLLSGQYIFKEEDVMLLLNPYRVDILKSFDKLSRTITPNDNLLIFFAGHGYYDPDAKLGYWLPADAESDFTANWIYNDVLVANLKRIHSKHTLLISDACFSGSIFQTRSMNRAPMAYQKKYNLPSRKAITSGVLEAVPNESVFFRYLADQLESNPDRYMSAGELFRNLEFPVSNNSPNSPRYGTIQNVDDEGGDFIFIRK
ncbi:MAG: caspase family protein, partial [Anaerolineales bacterium]|nr:caspase family protein [Anaerolineales bacterium]